MGLVVEEDAVEDGGSLEACHPEMAEVAEVHPPEKAGRLRLSGREEIAVGGGKRAEDAVGEVQHSTRKIGGPVRLNPEKAR